MEASRRLLLSPGGRRVVAEGPGSVSSPLGSSASVPIHKAYLPQPRVASPIDGAGTPSLRHQAINPQMISPGVASLVHQAPNSTSVFPSGQGMTLTRNGWSCKKTGKERSSSPGVAGLINGEKPLPQAECQEAAPALCVVSNTYCLSTSPRRGVTTPVRGSSETPWALDDVAKEYEQKLAQVARSCLQQTELQHEAGQRLQLRPYAGITAGTAGGGAMSPRRLGHNTPSVPPPVSSSYSMPPGVSKAGSLSKHSVNARESCRGSKLRPARAAGGSQNYNEGGPAALVKFESAVTQDAQHRAALQECANRIRPPSRV